MRPASTSQNESTGALTVSFQLPEEIGRRLDRFVGLSGHSKSDCMTEAIVEYLDNIEDLYLANRRLGDIHVGRSKLHSLDDIEIELGLGD